MSLPAILERYRSEVDSELKEIIHGRESPLYNMMSYHLGWIDEEGNPTKNNSGKALRPALCLFSCEAVGGNYHKAVPAAAAVELVHNFSLIHDDIQDDDKERRHRPTVWAIWGKPQAINAGTAMHILANAALIRLQGDGISSNKQLYLGQRLDEVTLSLLEGQYLDIGFEDRFDIKVNDYLTMVSGKTAALISGSMEIGALIGTNDENKVKSFSEVGKSLGLAFQIRDDILGIWGKEEETGKPSGNDIRRKKKSYPVVFFLENSGDPVKKELLSIYQNTDMTNITVNRVIELFDSMGARENAQILVTKYSDQAWLIFNQTNPSPSIKRDMEEVLQFLTDRNY
jgi:geranylgeranyl diphosphate synthase, type I